MPLVPREKDGAVLIDLQVVARASRVCVGPVVGDRLKVQVTAPPVDGEANAAVILALAEALGVPRRDVTIVAGESARRKTVRIRGIGKRALANYIEAE